MAIRRSGSSDAPGRAAAFIDPYWLLGRSAEPTPALVQALQAAVGAGMRLERVTWYLESDGGRRPSALMPRVTVRVAARDDLDDGFEVIRAMDADLRAAATSGVYDALLVATHDDRLAVTLEEVKRRGVLVFVCATTAEEPDARIVRIADEMIEPRAGAAREEDAGPPDETAVEAIEAAVAQWLTEADALEADRTRQYIGTRVGLPRPVDSRLLFLTRTRVGRDLRESERVLLRRRFRERVEALT
jgi:hypothetical protein